MTNDTLAPVQSITIVVDQTPHTCLRLNDTSSHWTKTKHRKSMRDAAYLAMHEAVTETPEIADWTAHGQLCLSYVVSWERRRQVWDRDGLIGGGLKAVQDGIAQKLGVDDRAFETGSIEQVVTKERLGWLTVTITPRTEIVEFKRATLAGGSPIMTTDQAPDEDVRERNGDDAPMTYIDLADAYVQCLGKCADQAAELSQLRALTEAQRRVLSFVHFDEDEPYSTGSPEEWDAALDSLREAEDLDAHPAPPASGETGGTR
jgi:hypothetical protein